ncbi:hypothetical protein [Streptomyces sp. NPDC091209]|uniref:hypothetical protein n=1 Tax=Streptomyces sp. NPDC091209 TaxID=3365974 RepID=UPI003805ABF5
MAGSGTRITVRSAAGGTAMSPVAMIAALLGRPAPAVGVPLQEAVDIADILNALRACS